MCIRDSRKILEEEMMGAAQLKVPLSIDIEEGKTLSLIHIWNGIATYLMAAEAGVDIVDCAIGSMSSLTSQPLSLIHISKEFGSMKNWVVALCTFGVVLILSNFTKGIFKLGSSRII